MGVSLKLVRQMKAACMKTAMVLLLHCRLHPYAARLQQVIAVAAVVALGWFRQAVAASQGQLTTGGHRAKAGQQG